MKNKLARAAGLGIALSLGGAGSALAQDPLKVGVLATLEGTYTVLGEDGMRGFQVALNKFGGMAGGREVEVIIGATDASPDSAIRAARKVVEQDGVDIVIGPLSGSEGIAIKDYAKTQPQVTFINGISGAQETTYVDPASNFFRFNMDGAQWSSGLAEYIYNEKGYRTIATIGEDYSFVYTQVFGLVLEFCALGGEVTERLWVPLGTKDFASIIAALPEDVDAIYLGLGGGDAVNFLNQYLQAGGDAALIGGTIMVDQTVLSSKGPAKNALIGTPASGPQADSWDDPKWQAFVKAYQDAFEPDKRFPLTLAARHRLPQRDHGRLDGAERHRRRPERRTREVPRRSRRTRARRAQRHDHARREPAGDRHELRDRGGRGRERQPRQRAREDHPQREPDAGARSGGLRDHRRSQPRSARVQGVHVRRSDPDPAGDAQASPVLFTLPSRGAFARHSRLAGHSWGARLKPLVAARRCATK